MSYKSNVSKNRGSSGVFLLASFFGILFFLLACGWVSLRAYQSQQIPGNFDAERGTLSWAFLNRWLPSDEPTSAFKTFQDELYFPARAMITGVNPYAPEYQDFHPAGRTWVVTSPTALALATPFGFLSVRESQWIYLAVCWLLAIGTVRLMFRIGQGRAPWGLVLFVVGLMTLSRPGLDELLNVGFMFPVVFGFALALEYSKRNVWISSLGFLITTCSITFAAPLAILMAFRRDSLALGSGLLLTVVVWASIAIALARGEAADFKRTIRQDLGRSLASGLLPSETQDAEDRNRECWERIDLKPTIIKILQREFLKNAESLGGEEVVSLPFQGAFGMSRAAGSNPTATLAIGFKRFTYVGERDLGWLIALACFAYGAMCLLLEKCRSQRQGLVSRSGLLIVFLTLLALPHGVSDGLLIWLPLVGLLFGFPVLVTGLNVLVRSLLVIVLMVVVFNFLTPALLQERAFIAVIPADSWQASVVASLNPILLTLAALLTGFSSVVSRFVPGEPANAAEILSEKQVAMESSRRQQAWAKLKRP